MGMEYAKDLAGLQVRAEAGAPGQALCLHCGATVVLRGRRNSYRPAEVTYFWRHQDNASLDCPSRLAGVNRVSPNGRS